MPEDKKLQRLQRLARIVDTSYVSGEEFKSALTDLINAVGSNLKNTKSDIQTQLDTFKKEIQSDTSSNVDELKNKYQDEIISIYAIISDLEFKQGDPGLPGEPGIGVPGKDGSPDTPEEIVTKLESLQGDSRLDKIAVKGFEDVATKTDLARGLSIVDNRTSFLINKINNLPAGGTTLTVTEIDGSPSATVSKIKFSNGSVTDNGDGSVTVTTGVGGGGDFSSNTSSSVDSEVVIFSGTGGKTGKRATGSGIARLTSGVLSVSKVAITEPATSSTLTIDDGFTLHATGDVTVLSGSHAGTSSGTNTGDQTTVSGNAGTATALQNARTIAGVSFNGTANILIASTNLSDTASIALLASTQTLTNKRVTKRVVATTQSATPTINTDNTDVSAITGLAQAITSFTTNLSGTPVAGDSLIIEITDNGTARGITWGTSFEASTVALPTTTVISTLLTVGFRWNTTTSKWRCVASA